ncbi:hypothetical protein GX51_06286 [Blastomyces parvus]|uniref:Mid2 domain-containing protein n=1 Tax=Blastomyces parvus TaxID=2060905 RepID=A0A2B7WS96_9EURO|nr:hypothetical protein GX51_06286 [Blastomyces parvus]
MRWTSSFSLLLFSVLLLAIAVVGAEQPNHDGRKRQIISIDDPKPSETESSSEEPTSSSTSSTSSEKPTTTSETSKDTPTTKPTDPPTKTTDSRPTRTEPTTPPPTRTNSPSPTRSSVIIVTNTITRSGSTFEQTATSTLDPGQTAAPGLGNDGNGGRSSSGLSESSKRTIIGVVVGVGGAVILGGLAFVAWRLRRKRNARGPGDDDLMNAGTAVGSSSYETTTTGAGHSPFKSTLDQYHHPGGVNPSSNF